jgi:hypothetical protein
MGLPYILATGSEGPGQGGGQDSASWDLTLHRILSDRHAVMKELGEGSRDITLTMTGWT